MDWMTVCIICTVGPLMVAPETVKQLSRRVGGEKVKGFPVIPKRQRYWDESGLYQHNETVLVKLSGIGRSITEAAAVDGVGGGVREGGGDSGDSAWKM